MNVFQRIKGWAKRVVRAAIGYEGATNTRRGHGWDVATGSADMVARWSVTELRQRSRHLVRNHWAASHAVDVLTAKIVGKGILPSCRDDAEFDALLNLWASPQTQVGSAKGQSLGAVQRIVCRTVIESGAAIVVRQRRTRRQMRQRGLVMPFQVAVLEPEYLDVTRDGTLDSGNRVSNGIEYDATGWPVAYWIHDRHPSTVHSYSALDSSRIDAEDVELVLWRKRPGQTIGVPWFAPVLQKVKDFDEYEDAQLLRQKIASMYAMFIRTGIGGGDAPSDDEISLEPGIVQWLEPGEEVEFTDPPSVAGYGDYTHVTLRSIASGLGLTYEDLSGDFSQVNFSSARMGAITSRELIDQWQAEMMIGLLCQKLEQWAREAAGLLVDSDTEECPVRWTAPRRELLDPSREVGAIERAIKAGLTSRQEEVRRLGRDINDVDRERAQDAEREEELGLAEAGDDEEPDAEAQMRRVMEDIFTEHRMH